MQMCTNATEGQMNIHIYTWGKKETQVQIFKYWKFVCEQTDLVFCIWWH